MDDKEKYKDITSLTAELASQVKALEMGKLPAGDLDSMAEKARELYERIIVIRHLAYERIVKNEAEESMAREPRQMPFKINMNRPPISKNQTSLIDVIEELTSDERGDLELDTQEPEEETAEESNDVEESPIAEEEIEEPKEEEPEVVEKQKAEDRETEVKDEEEEEVPEPSTIKIEPEAEIEPVSLEDEIEEKQPLKPPQQEQQETLGDRLKMSPLADLKKAIGLNQKFQFINELFEGDADDYAESIEKLNTAGDMESAIEFFENQLAAKKDWEEDQPSVLDLRELVQRRYL
jgi:hypothetical protein